ARLTIHMGAAFARACAAVLEARRLLASLDRLEARGLVEQASSAWSRAVTQMLDALRAAQGAFGHLSERDGGVRARSVTPAAIVRRRHPGPHH
ncbi:MAG: hypothetical protein KDK70_42020, partial [Myxococcales bacterium]|nr:hypothetical protein [Myxococcales bacterium]